MLFGMAVVKPIAIFLNNFTETARVVTGAIKETSGKCLLNEAWVKLKERCSYHELKMIYKILNNFAPSYLLQLCPVQVRSRKDPKKKGMIVFGDATMKAPKAGL